MKANVGMALVLVVSLWLTAGARAQTTNTNVAVSFLTANPIPLNQGFAGFCTEMLSDAVEYSDPNFQQITATLSPGWLRFPGGGLEDAFDWTTGTNRADWIAAFPSWEEDLLNKTTVLCPGKGGLQFSNFAAMCANVGGAKIVVCVNGFTDSATSAGNFAAYALSNHIQVAAWELCNEPYVFDGPGSSFFTNATDYANAMLPFRNAIKAADPDAVVALYFNDAGAPFSNAWDIAMGSYTNKYWDAVVYHHYPQLPTNGVAFSNLMLLDNWQLASNTTARVNYLMQLNNSNVTYLITEFAPAGGDGQGGQNPPTATLYGGIYTAEYLLRMAAIPQMTFVGPYQLVDSAGIDMTNDNYSAVTTAYDAGRTTNTSGLPFGFYLSSQVCGQSIADWALTRSTAVYTTTVGTNCPTVGISNTSIGTIPAIYAQACQGGNGKRYIVLTNKGSNAVPVQITQDETNLTNVFLETYVTGSDPSVTNAAPPNSAVLIQTATVTNPITIPQYSVVRLEWTVFNVPAPVLSLTVTNSVPTLQWTGLTNVVYDVQGSANLALTWATLGKISSAETNFSFSDPDGNPFRFYRLLVP